ncbi:hypothetical protein ACOSP7_026012 [Xanthoceras sorbifolium]
MAVSGHRMLYKDFLYNILYTFRSYSLFGQICGRPLGLGIHTSTGKIYIADAYTGLLVVGRNGGLATQLATTANGVPFCFLDGLDVDQLIGDVYFTDASAQLLLVLVTKFIGKRVQRYWLKGLKANTAEVIATFNGRPANIKRTPSGGVFDGSQLRNTCSTSYGSCRNKIEFIWSCFGENVCYSPIQQYFDQSSSGIWLSSRQRFDESTYTKGHGTYTNK